MILKLVKKYAKLCKTKEPIFRTRQILNTSLVLFGLYNSEIKKIVKEIIDKDKILLSLDTADLSVFEVQLIYVKLISNLDFDRFCYYLSKISVFIDSWAITDAVEFKKHNQEKNKIDLLIKNLLNSKNYWEIRIGYILRLQYFKTDYSINKLISEMNMHNHHEFYYVKMVIAWLGQVLYLNYPSEILNYLKNPQVNLLTKKMTIRKLLDSFRLSDEEKSIIKKL